MKKVCFEIKQEKITFDLFESGMLLFNCEYKVTVVACILMILPLPYTNGINVKTQFYAPTHLIPGWCFVYKE